MSDLSQELKEELLQEIKLLETQLTGNLFEDMDTRDKIHNIKMKLEGVRPTDSFVECIGCGS
ncbi:hypothetical protein HBN50_14830 [Halobacteriovorax sp. GB3]|uniref:hypothetical protein n=1 Tax=Halobacteriovorax sp. GB3 TaxID=2719615 RepID=UPI00235DEBE2|nr:hypothetical protein [Halobacteriovorax sp. GB3]MDD0854385.1 hypothetical protein [Halobacteriovorax sp. GB3]